MNDNDYQEFLGQLTGISELYQRPISERGIDLWWRCLAGFDLQNIKTAFESHVMSPDNGRFFPTPSDIVRQINGSSMECAELAWTTVDRAIRMVGTYQTVDFGDPKIHYVIADMGGWIGLGEKSEKDWPFVATEFKRRYADYARRPQLQPGIIPRMIGITEADNRLLGYDEDVSVVICLSLSVLTKKSEQIVLLKED